MTEQQALDEIYQYIHRDGGRYSEWYVGIATNPRERLFTNHSVNERTDLWIFRPCSSSESARNIEAYFLRMGARGGTGGGDYGSAYVYAYKIASHTIETA